MSGMYHWWHLLKIICAFKMFVDGMIIAYLIRISVHLALGHNPVGYGKLFGRGLAAVGISVVVTIFALIMAARYECPWFYIFQYPLEPISIGVLNYGFAHIGWKYGASDPDSVL